MKLKNIKLLPIALIILLTSCVTSGPTDSLDDSSSESTSEIVSDSSSVTTIDSSSDSSENTASDTSSNTSGDSSSDSSSSSEVNPEPQQLSISQIRALSLALASSADANGNAVSSSLVEFTGKLLARLDAITTKRNYGNRYKLLFVDATGYIYVKVDSATYGKVEKNIGKSFVITGNPSLYAGAAEVTISSYVAASNISVNLASISESVPNIAAIHNHLTTLRLNNKGVAFDKLVRFEATYIAKADDSVLLFTDGANAIYVHGDSYIGNRFSLNSSYRLTVSTTMYNFRPNVELIEQEAITSQNIDLNAVEVPSLTASELYKYKYEVDKNASYPNYSSKFTSLFVYQGYANYYYKDGSRFIVLEDVFNPDVYLTYQNAATKKSIFVKNEDSTNLYGEYEYSLSPFAEYISDEPIKIEILFMPYLWNTNEYWQGYFLTNTIKTVEYQ